MSTPASFSSRIRSTPGMRPSRRARRFFDPPGASGVTDGTIVVQLVEAELRMDLEHGTLPIRRHLLVHLGDLLQHPPGHHVHPTAVGRPGLGVGGRTQRGTCRRRQRGTRSWPAEQGTCQSVAGPAGDTRLVGQPDRGEEGHDLKCRLVVEHVEEPRHEPRRLGRHGDALQLGRRHQPAVWGHGTTPASSAVGQVGAPVGARHGHRRYRTGASDEVVERCRLWSRSSARPGRRATS